jgi:sterol desaturase/sphingolipid hydroxylase (fatty acid hydroxylase superfamily)
VNLEALALDLAAALLAFVVLLLIFRPLELAYPASRGQAFLRPGWSTDLCFFLGQYLVWIAVVLDVLGDFTPWLHGLVPPAVRRAVSRQPFWLQFVEVVLLGDFLIYWAHRLQHRVDWLWRFHAVHHSAEHLDWLAAHREHPVDTIYSVTIMNLPAYMLGFSPPVMASFITFRGLWAIFIHSNVRISLGPLGLLFGSPAYHHWHHERDRDSCNFGNVAPLMDVLFGTHHDPGHEPEALGLREPAARGYLGLLLNPFLPRWLHVDAPSPSPARVRRAVRPARVPGGGQHARRGRRLFRVRPGDRARSPTVVITRRRRCLPGL